MLMCQGRKSKPSVATRNILVEFCWLGASSARILQYCYGSIDLPQTLQLSQQGRVVCWHTPFESFLQCKRGFAGGQAGIEPCYQEEGKIGNRCVLVSSEASLEEIVLWILSCFSNLLGHATAKEDAAAKKDVTILTQGRFHEVEEDNGEKRPMSEEEFELLRRRSR